VGDFDDISPWSTAQDRAVRSWAFVLFDIPVSPRVRASARSWATLHVSFGLMTLSTLTGSTRGRPGADPSPGAPACIGFRVGPAAWRFCLSFSSRARARKADRFCDCASFRQRSARFFAFFSAFSVFVSWPRRMDSLFSSSWRDLDFSAARFCFLLRISSRSSVFTVAPRWPNLSHGEVPGDGRALVCGPA